MAVRVPRPAIRSNGKEHPMLNKASLILAVLLVCTMQSAIAQQPAPVPEKAPDLVVEKAYCRDASLTNDLCELGDTLHVSFANLQKWMEADSAKNKPAALVLVLDDRVMKGISARGPKTDFKELGFDLKFLETSETDSKDNGAAWTALLSKAKSKRTLNVSVALGGNPPYAGSATMTLQVFPS